MDTSVAMAERAGWLQRAARLKPSHLLAGLNSLILVVAQYKYNILNGYWVLALAVTVSILTEVALSRVMRGRPPSLLNGYISGVSTTLLTKAAAGLAWPIAAVAAFSIASKSVLTWRGRHLWNPTNFGIGVMLLAAPGSTAILSHEFGNSLWANLAIWCVGLAVVARARLLHITLAYVLTFLALSSLRSALIGSPLLTEIAPITGPMYQLFIFFQITDPPTAVAGRRKQIVVAVLVAVVEAALRLGNDFDIGVLHPFAPAPAIFGLFIVGPLAKAIDLELAERRSRRRALGRSAG